MLFCSACRTLKPETDFHVASRAKTGRQSTCKVCQKEYAAQKYLRNRSKILERTKAYILLNPEVAKKAAKKYVANNVEKLRARDVKLRLANPQKYRDRDARFSRENKEKVAAKAAKRRAGKLQATPGWADLEVVAYFYIAAKAMSDFSGEKYHVDHIVPLKSKIVCGLHCPANMQILLWSENIKKSNRYWPDMPDFV